MILHNTEILIRKIKHRPILELRLTRDQLEGIGHCQFFLNTKNKRFFSGGRAACGLPNLLPRQGRHGAPAGPGGGPQGLPEPLGGPPLHRGEQPGQRQPFLSG